MGLPSCYECYQHLQQSQPFFWSTQQDVIWRKRRMKKTVHLMKVVLLRILKTKADKLKDVEISIVDGFQGREKEAIIISMVRSNTKKEGLFSWHFRGYELVEPYTILVKVCEMNLAPASMSRCVVDIFFATVFDLLSVGTAR